MRNSVNHQKEVSISILSLASVRLFSPCLPFPNACLAFSFDCVPATSCSSDYCCYQLKQIKNILLILGYHSVVSSSITMTTLLLLLMMAFSPPPSSSPLLFPSPSSGCPSGAVGQCGGVLALPEVILLLVFLLLFLRLVVVMFLLLYLLQPLLCCLKLLLLIILLVVVPLTVICILSDWVLPMLSDNNKKKQSRMHTRTYKTLKFHMPPYVPLCSTSAMIVKSQLNIIISLGLKASMF